MKFPGSKLLHHWDLATHPVSLDDLLRSCQQVGLTGFAEVKFPQAVAMIFYYLGGEVNALYREGAVAYHGHDALERVKALVETVEGQISVYELPLDMAHLLRGLTNRQRLKDVVRSASDLADLLRRLEKSEHTGTLEVQNRAGDGMLLLVRGRVSSVYWDSADGVTFEKGEARRKLDGALTGAEDVNLHLSEFSRDVWKSRHEVTAPLQSRLERRDAPGHAKPDQVAAEESAQRQQVLEELAAAVPALIQAFIFDLLTGGILSRRGRGTSAVRVGLLAEKVPAFTLYLRDLVAVQDEDHVELIELSTERAAILVAIVPEALEAIAVIADRAQPTALVGAALSRAVRSYAGRLHPARGVAG